ncbi:MAG: Lrp/AsnC family transcriptional regulator [Pseudomonadota bacterium]|nr:Lrp/AsnC family transcriptional regulator [Pseudomonadota bacterium]
MRRTGDLDAKDRHILALLEADARRSVSDIGRLTGLSAPTVTERIARLKDIGVIRRFAAQIDYAKVGLPTGAIIQFKPHMNKDAKAYEFACGREEVRDIYLVTGSALIVMIVRLADNVLLNDLLIELAQFGETNTSVILNTVEEWRPLFACDSRTLGAEAKD